MFFKKDWHKILALTLFIVLLGGYYERLDLEARTMVLPLGIIVIAAFMFTRLRRFEYEMRSATVVAQGIASQVFSLLDSEGKERVSISTASGETAVTFYDDSHETRAVLNVFNTEPGLKLVGNKGSAWVGFDDEGMPYMTLKDDGEEIVWEAPPR